MLARTHPIYEPSRTESMCRVYHIDPILAGSYIERVKSWEEFSRKGGKASAAKQTAGMTPAEKSEYYRNLVALRWERERARKAAAALDPETRTA